MFQNVVPIRVIRRIYHRIRERLYGPRSPDGLHFVLFSLWLGLASYAMPMAVHAGMWLRRVMPVALTHPTVGLMALAAVLWALQKYVELALQLALTSLRRLARKPAESTPEVSLLALGSVLGRRLAQAARRWRQSPPRN